MRELCFVDGRDGDYAFPVMGTDYAGLVKGYHSSYTCLELCELEKEDTKRLPSPTWYLYRYKEPTSVFYKVARSWHHFSDALEELEKEQK